MITDLTWYVRRAGVRFRGYVTFKLNGEHRCFRSKKLETYRVARNWARDTKRLIGGPA